MSGTPVLTEQKVLLKTDDAGGIWIASPVMVSYLEALAHALFAASGPELGEFRPLIEQIEAMLGEEIALPTPAELAQVDRQWVDRALGYADLPRISGLLDREWLQSENEEFARLAAILRETAVLGAAKKVYICGDGVCRLGDYLSSLDQVTSVCCADLSFLILYFGRIMIRGDRGLLPKSFSKPRKFFEIDALTRTLVGRDRYLPYREPFGSPERLPRFEVADIFGLPVPTDVDLVCVPYVFDTTTGARLETMAIRLCEALAVGQKLLIVVTLLQGRDPRTILQALDAGGVTVTDLALYRLGYSSARYDYGHTAVTFTTLFIEAEKTRETAGDRIQVVANFRHEDRAAFHRGLREKAFPRQTKHPLDLDADQSALVCDALAGATDYAGLRQRLRAGLDEPATEQVLYYLTAEDKLSLRVAD